jgi:hypothetical protein
MFQADFLSISSSLDSVYTATGICHASYVDCLLGRSECSILTSLADSMTNTGCCVYSIETPDDGQEVCPKHVELYINLKLRYNASCWLPLYEYTVIPRLTSDPANEFFG